MRPERNLRHLRRLLWRFRAGTCDEARLVVALESEIELLAFREEELAAAHVLIRQSGLSLLEDFEEGRNGAVRELGRRRYHETVEHLRRSGEILSLCEEHAERLRRLQDAEARLREVRTEPTLRPLADLPPFTLRQRLLEVAVQSVANADPARSALLVRVACESTEALLTEGDVVLAQERIGPRLEALRARVPEAALRAVEYCLERRRSELARQLLDELEDEAERHASEAHDLGPLIQELEMMTQRSDRLRRRLATRWTHHS